MTARLTTEFICKALIRRVHDAGGSAAVMARGDATGGMILILALERGQNPVFWERGFGPDGRMMMVQSGPRDADAEQISSYWQRRRRNDPDLWVIELDIAFAERFAAETICGD